MKTKIYLIAAGLLLGHAAYSQAIFTENFDALQAGTLAGQGGWTQNVAGTMTVVNDPDLAFSVPNFMTIGGGGAAQHSFAKTNLTEQATQLSFHFLNTGTVAGRNIQLSVRSETSGNASVFYLNLLGNGTGLQAGVNSSSVSSYAYSAPMATNEWYVFTLANDPVSSMMSFSVVPSSGGSALVTGSISYAGTDGTASRLVFSSNASTAAGEWAIDNIAYMVVVPEANTVALILVCVAGCVVALRRRSSRG